MTDRNIPNAGAARRDDTGTGTGVTAAGSLCARAGKLWRYYCWRPLCSVIAAFAGVQSQKKHSEDIADNNPWALIAAGIVMAAILVLLLIILVKNIVSSIHH